MQTEHVGLKREVLSLDGLRFITIKFVVQIHRLNQVQLVLRPNLKVEQMSVLNC